jgi:AcrR family transcriptional regulator
MGNGGARAHQGSAAGEIQRKRTSRRNFILDAVVEVVAERGLAGASVELVLARAGVSRRGFYACFANLDECLVAISDRALEHFGVLVSRGFAGQDSWLDGMRGTLAGVLDFFDSEPVLARVFIVEALGAGPVVREHRAGVIEAMRLLILARIEGEVVHASPLEPEGVVASVMGIIHARLVGSERQPLIELLGPLMGIVVGPFMERAQVMREIERGDAMAAAILVKRFSRPPAQRRSADRGATIPAALRDPRAHRARACLLYVSGEDERGRSPSNKEIGEAIGVFHRGQRAKLLRRLVELGLLVKREGASGHPNAWSVTAAGESVASVLAENR